VRESVRPMEKIEGIKILHIDGSGGGGGANRNVTDEVIDSALRYRVQAPMIDSLMKEIGIEGGGLGRMTEVLRDAKDIESLTSKRAKADRETAPEARDTREDER
jgi:Flotillin